MGLAACNIQGHTPSVSNYFTTRNQIIFRYMELIKYLVHTINILFIENSNSPVVGAEPSEKG